MKCCEVTIGKLHNRITFESASDAVSSYGDITKTWSTHASAWAYIRPVNSHDVYLAGAFNNKVTHKIVVRYDSTLTAAMRIKFGSRYFTITGIKNMEEEDRYWEIDAVESAQAAV